MLDHQVQSGIGKLPKTWFSLAFHLAMCWAGRLPSWRSLIPTTLPNQHSTVHPPEEPPEQNLAIRWSKTLLLSVEKVGHFKSNYFKYTFIFSLSVFSFLHFCAPCISKQALKRTQDLKKYTFRKWCAILSLGFKKKVVGWVYVLWAQSFLSCSEASVWLCLCSTQPSSISPNHSVSL